MIDGLEAIFLGLALLFVSQSVPARTHAAPPDSAQVSTMPDSSVTDSTASFTRSGDPTGDD